MVSLRSGKRVSRPSPSTPLEKPAETSTNPMETPKRAVKGQKTVEEKEKLPISLRKSERLAKNSGENSSAEIAEEHKEIVAPSQENSVDDDAESTQLSVDVFADPSDFEDDDDEVVPETDYEDNNEEPKNDQNPVEIPDNSDSDDDEPMEISSKNPVTSIENPENSDSDDDEPMEATSKAPEMSVAEPKSIIEKLLEKKAEKSAKLAAKKLKKRSKKKEAKKISDGVFQVKMKKSKAKFNVVTLKAGVQNILEPQINFREELLKSRTAGTRLADTEKFLQRGKWVKTMNRANDTSSNLKLISLVVLIVQTTALVLTLRYSQTQKSEGPRYLSSTAVVCAEIIKLITCFFVIYRNNGYRFSGMLNELNREIFASPQTRADSLKVAVPAIMYVIQNNLLFFALKKLDAATYQVTYQLKILTTAIFSVTMLGKSLHRYNWMALILLTAGVALVQYPSGDSTTSKSTAAEHDASDNILGLGAVLAACFSSGFAGVYFEKILKTSKVSLWIRNIQLAFFSVFGALLVCWLYDWQAISDDGFLRGYNGVIWIVVLLQAYGGLVIALVVKYADNILKGFAVSLSIILSSFTSWLVLGDLTITTTFAIGATVVIFATFLYGHEPKSTPAEAHNA